MQQNLFLSLFLSLALFLLLLRDCSANQSGNDCEMSEECPHPCFQRIHHCPNCHNPQDAAAKSFTGWEEAATEPDNTVFGLIAAFKKEGDTCIGEESEAWNCTFDSSTWTCASMGEVHGENWLCKNVHNITTGRLIPEETSCKPR